MNTIPVHASTSYPVMVGRDLIAQAGKLLAEQVSVCKAAIISESNVFPLYGSDLSHSLQQAGFTVHSFTFPAGESSKNGATYLEILNFLAENHFSRSDILIALGGGVTGDITGFAAATYLRGIAYVQIPTTLLAMVDSSVGGKTAIDLPTGKNLAGAFCQPSLVLCDLNTLNTLPETVFRDGCAEVIKYGVLYDEALFAHLSEKGMAFDRESVICRCIALKRDVVAADEFDKGLRQKLNFGHTVGHGIEAHSGYTISHGQAVATGMAIVAKASAAYHLCDESVYKDICNALTTFGLPSQTEYSSGQLFASALSDKKRSGETVNFVIPERIGCCKLYPLPVSQIQSFIEAGL